MSGIIYIDENGVKFDASRICTPDCTRSMICFRGRKSTLSRILFTVVVVVIFIYLFQLRWMTQPRKVVGPIVHAEEEQFPLAFSILMYTDLDRTVRLMQAIYRPHNCYCIHVDRKTDESIHTTLKQLMQQLYGDTVYVIPRERSIKVEWGWIHSQDADLLCSRILLDRCSQWKYWINLTGQEFPLRTNWELVRALTILNGSNLIDAIYKRRNMDRFPLHWRSGFPVTWYKGVPHVVARREFVHFIHNDERAKLILRVLRDFEQSKKHGIFVDETYLPTLNHNPASIPAPGAFLGVHESDIFTPPIRVKVWSDQNMPCHSGKWVRTICMLGLRDVDWLMKRPEFFANKFIPSVEPEGYTLMERWLSEKVEYESINGKLHPSFNTTHYLSLELRWNHL
ncbi:unnamed protein product [Dicrocoelium dendriticum]|nr:unnamed protein product [Dicrocoelium dendriticum]